MLLLLPYICPLPIIILLLILLFSLLCAELVFNFLCNHHHHLKKNRISTPVPHNLKNASSSFSCVCITSQLLLLSSPIPTWHAN